jgi:hypothetical protein
MLVNYDAYIMPPKLHSPNSLTAAPVGGVSDLIDKLVESQAQHKKKGHAGQFLRPALWET